MESAKNPKLRFRRLTVFLATASLLFGAKLSSKENIDLKSGYRFKPPPGWVESLAQGGQRSWHPEKNQTRGLTILTDVASQPFFIDSEKPNRFFQTLLRARQYTLGIFGLSEYRFSDQRIEKRKHGFIVSLQGNFQGADGVEMGFHERQVYIGNRYYQLTLNYEKSAQDEMGKNFSAWAAELKIDP